MAAAIAAIAASSVASTTTSAASAAVAASHLVAAAAHHQHQQHQHHQQQQHHHHHHLPPPPHATHPHAHHPHAHHGGPHHPHPHLAPHPHHPHHPNSGLLGLRGLSSGIVPSNAAAVAAAAAAGGLTAIGAGAGHVPDICPVCGVKLTAEEWNSHFHTELDRLYKLSSGMERTNLQASYMFAPPCPAQENAIRTSHNRWETFQRIRNNRQNRLRIKIRKRKYGNELYFMENIFCSSCPICKRKYALETGKLPPEDEQKMQEEIETVDVESCNDDVAPDSGTSELQHGSGGGVGGSHLSLGGSNNSALSGNSSTAGLMHNSNNQPGKLDGILYRTACVINEKANSSMASHGGDDEANATATSSSGLGCGSSNSNDASNWHGSPTAQTQQTVVNTQMAHGHISVKNVSELSSTTHHFYNADSCGDEQRGVGLLSASCGKDMSMSMAMAMDTSCNNDSDEDVIVDDDDSIKMANLCKKRAKYEDAIVVSSRSSENRSPLDERPRSEPQVTSTEPNMELASNNNNNNNNNNKYSVFDELRAKQQQLQQQNLDADTGHNAAASATSTAPSTPGQTSSSSCSTSSSLSAATPTTTTTTPPQQQQQQQQLMVPGLTQLDSKVGINLLDNIKPNDDENKCFICKTGIKDLSTDSFFRGRNLYFHQSCANVMSSYRLSKELQHQQQQQQQQHQHSESARTTPDCERD